MLLNLKCIVLPLLALFTVNTVLSASAAKSRATKDGTSSAIGTVSNIGIFEHQQHHRRWRRGNSGGLPSLGSLRRGALRSKSGQLVANAILPIDETETDKKPNWLNSFKRAFKPASQQSHDKAVKKIQEHQLRFAFGAVLAQNMEQLHKLKELLKAALFYEQTLNLFSNELVKEEANLQNAKEKLIKQKSAKTSAEAKNKWRGIKSEENKKQRSAEGKNKGKGLKSEEHQRPDQQNCGKMQQDLVAKLQKRVNKLSKIKGEIKKIIKEFDKLTSREDFNFASKIYRWKSVRDDVELGAVLNNWEGKKPDEWDKNDLKIWMKNNTKSQQNAHELHTFAIGQTDITTKNLVNQILLLDAALDREARNLCLNTAFVVPMRNWAEISQEMTEEQIKKYVTNVLGDNFLGLQITFDPNIGSTFDESVDFEEIDESKKRSNLKGFWHNVSTACRPYSSRGPETHLKQLEAKNTKLSWDILKALNREDRITAKESVKLAVYLMMTIEKAYSDDVKAKIEEAKKAVECQRREVKKVKKEHKRAHKSSRHISPVAEHQMTPSISDQSSNSSSQEGNDDNDDDELLALAKLVAKGAGMLSPIVEVDLEGSQSDNSNQSSDDHDDSDQGVSPAESESGGTQSDNSNHSSADLNYSDQGVSPMLKPPCPIKQKVKESREQLAAAKAHHHKLIGSRKETKKSRESLYKLQKSKSGRDGFGIYFESIKTKAKGNEIYEQINGQIVENAKQQLQLQNVDRLDDAQVEALVEKHMREVFAEGPGNQFLLNMIELSKQMTAFEIRQCAEKFSWFPGCNVQINDGQITHNGSGKKRPPMQRQINSDNEDDESRRPRGLSRSSSTASTSSTQRRADGSRDGKLTKSTKSVPIGGKRGKRHHTRR